MRAARAAALPRLDGRHALYRAQLGVLLLIMIKKAVFRRKYAFFHEKNAFLQQGDHSFVK